MAQRYQRAFTDTDDTDVEELMNREYANQCSRTSRDRSRSPNDDGGKDSDFEAEEELIDLTADEESNFVCNVGSCGRSYTSRQKLGYHKRQAHWAYRGCTICKKKGARPEQYRLDRVADVHVHFSQYHSRTRCENRLGHTVECYGKERELLDGGWAAGEEEGRSESPQPSTSRGSGRRAFPIRARDTPAQRKIRSLEKALAAANVKNQELSQKITEERVEMEALRARNSSLQVEKDKYAKDEKTVHQILLDITTYINSHPQPPNYVVQKRAELQRHFAQVWRTSASTSSSGTGRQAEGPMQIVPSPNVEQYNRKEAELEEAKQKVAELEEQMKTKVAELEEANKDVLELQWQLGTAIEDRNKVLEQLHLEEAMNGRLLEERNKLQGDLDRVNERCRRRDDMWQSLCATNKKLELERVRLNRIIERGGNPR